MKYLLFLILIFCNCNERKDTSFTPGFKYVDFTFDDGWGSGYSLVMENNGTIYIGKGRKTKTYFKALIEAKDLQQIDSMLQVLSESKTDSLYVDKKVDQSSFMLIYRDNNGEHKHYVYGANAPVQLFILREKISNLLNYRMSQFDTVIKFKSDTFFYPPLLDPTPGLKILPPSSNNLKDNE